MNFCFNMPIRNCSHCSRPFDAKCNFNKYCTPSCAFWRWVRVKSPKECWEWMGTRFHHGYGRMKYHGTVWYANRFSWELHNGPIPEGKLVCHECDNPPCCNPIHLWVGTYKENADDRDRKGRQIPFRGEQHGGHRLTEDDVRLLRSMYESGIRGKELDSAFSIAQGYGWRIAMRKMWKHVH